MATVKIRIPGIITADGKWAVSGSHQAGEPDWGWLDEMCDFENPTVSPHRFFVEAEVEIPEVGTVQGTVTLS